MEFIIQHNLMNADALAAVSEAVKPYPHQFVGLIPFSHEITSDAPLVGRDYIPYGSTLLTTLALEYDWTGLYFDLGTFNYDAARIERYRFDEITGSDSSDMLNCSQDDYILTVDQAINFLENNTKEDQWFIRPSQDLKHFSGQVIERTECIKWLKDAKLCDSSGTYKMDGDMDIVLARPKKIQAEWRYFIVDKKIISGAMYRAHGQRVNLRETDDSVLAEAQSLANGWLPNDTCVMDLALVDSGLKIIEFNCINSSGFYGHDVNAIFRALYETAH